MNKETLIYRLEQVRKLAEEDQQELDIPLISKLIIDSLLDYLGNDDIRKKVDEIPF